MGLGLWVRGAVGSDNNGLTFTQSDPIFTSEHAMNFHIGNASSGRLFSSHSMPHIDLTHRREHSANYHGIYAQGGHGGIDAQERSFFKRHSLLAAYIAFAAVLCVGLAAVATVAIHGFPALLAGT